MLAFSWLALTTPLILSSQSSPGSLLPPVSAAFSSPDGNHTAPTSSPVSRRPECYRTGMPSAPPVVLFRTPGRIGASLLPGGYTLRMEPSDAIVCISRTPAPPDTRSLTTRYRNPGPPVRPPGAPTWFLIGICRVAGTHPVLRNAHTALFSRPALTALPGQSTAGGPRPRTSVRYCPSSLFC